MIVYVTIIGTSVAVANNPDTAHKHVMDILRGDVAEIVQKVQDHGGEMRVRLNIRMVSTVLNQ